jgi:hypothetical protein
VDDLPPKDPSQAFVTALVTEHFVLQSARSATVSEAVGAVAAIGVFVLHMRWMYRRGRPAMA